VKWNIDLDKGNRHTAHHGGDTQPTPALVDNLNNEDQYDEDEGDPEQQLSSHE